MPSPALLVLEDGAAYRGEAVAGAGTVGGEIVFNTAMTGYQEIATDPSYCGQIITYTFPLNGNYGADPSRDESGQAHARAIIARELVNYAFNRASTTSWLDWLNAHGVLAVGGVDTRALTRHIRSQGALRAVVSTDDPDVGSLRRRAQKLPRMAGLDLASVVTCARAVRDAGERRAGRRRPGAPRRGLRLRHQTLDRRLSGGRRLPRDRRAGGHARPATFSSSLPTASSCRTGPATRRPSPTP